MCWQNVNFGICVCVQGILLTVVKKMKYDESYNFDQEVSQHLLWLIQ